jgi:citrate lyase beta subunit
MTDPSAAPRRSTLSVPGHVEKMHQKAATCAADVVMLDLEDSVPEVKKAEARAQVIESLRALDFGHRLVALRINGLDTPYGFRDLFEVVSAVGARIDSVVLPKVEHEGDVHFADRLLTGLELEATARGERSADAPPIGLEPSIESALGLERASAIAAASTRNVALVFGVADYTSSIGARLVSLSGHGENDEAAYGGHRFHYVLSRLVMCAKAHGLLAIDAPFGHFKDEAGLARAAAQAAALGCDGKWAIHPSQLEVLNRTFTPDEAELEHVRAIVAAEAAAGQAGRGALAVDGRMVDRATVRLARRRLAQFEAIARRS